MKNLMWQQRSCGKLQVQPDVYNWISSYLLRGQIYSFELCQTPEFIFFAKFYLLLYHLSRQFKEDAAPCMMTIKEIQFLSVLLCSYRVITLPFICSFSTQLRRRCLRFSLKSAPALCFVSPLTVKIPSLMLPDDVLPRGSCARRRLRHRAGERRL